MTTPTPAGWFADPLGRHEMRYYDGQQWTEHVSSHGRQSVDPPTGTSHVPTVQRDSAKVAGDVQRAGQAGTAAFQGGGSLFTEPVLVVNQKAKIIEVTNQYSVYNQHGQQVASVNEVGQSTLRKAFRLLSNYDQYLTHRF